MNSMTRDGPCSATFDPPHPLSIDMVVEEIFSHLGDGYDEQLLNYRLVSHKWNDVVVRKYKKSGRSFQISLRYGSEVPHLIDRSVAVRSSNEVLESTIGTLKGTAARLTFDTIIVGQGFYLAEGVISKWKELLEMEGELIHHVKFNNSRSASADSTEDEESSFHEVTDCENIVSMESLRSTFSATPNLESLDICIEFAKSDQRLFPEGHIIPRLENLCKITIVEPRGVSYSRQFLTDIFSLAPNLSSLYSKPSNQMNNVAHALNAEGSPKQVTTLGIDNAIINHPVYPYSEPLEHMQRQCKELRHFPFLKLTTLELNNIFSEENFILRHQWIEKILETHSSTLVKLVLGTNNSSSENTKANFPIALPPVMKTLQILEVNVTTFGVFNIENYEKQFPVLQSLTLTGGHIYGKGWNRADIGYFLPGRLGRSNSLQKFSLSRPLQPSIKNKALARIRATFPMAECHFDS